MGTLFIDYINAVVKDYHRKKTANSIAPGLANPTPGRLKVECLIVCKERFLKKDEKALRTFFEHPVDQRTYFQIINEFDIDKFRPLVKFLKNGTKETDDKNIELLAWLIDFEGRPFDSQRAYGVSDKQPLAIEEETKIQRDKEKENGPIMPVGNTDLRKANLVMQLPAKTKTTLKTIAAVVILAILSSVIYFSVIQSSDGGKPQSMMLTGHESCMYWTGDHYQKVPCAQKLGDTMLIPLDSARLMHFKKISNWDVITKNSIENLWYFKINEDSLELYTADGEHPVYRNKRLKHLTTYMYNNYIKPRSK